MKTCLVPFACAILCACSSCAKADAESTETEAIDPMIGRVEEASMVLPDDARLAFQASFHADRDRFLALLEAAMAFSEAQGDLLILVDKRHDLSPQFEPVDLVFLDDTGLRVTKPRMSLRKPALDALLAMDAAARAEGVRLEIGSAYRSYEYQAGLFERNVKAFGLAETERFSARPGQSQHQLGTAIDFSPIDATFGESISGRWVAINAARFGFSQSFPAGMEAVTGFIEESWHWRWIGPSAVMLQHDYFMDTQQYLLEFLRAWVKRP